MTAAQRLVSQFDRMLGSDGGRIELLEETPTTVKIKYYAGSSICEQCAMSADDLRAMIAEALQRQAPSIASVEVVT